MSMSRPHHLRISLELRQAILSLQTRFWNDYWEKKFESVDDETRLKYRANDYSEDKFESVADETRLKYQALVRVMYNILDKKGTAADFVTMREACVPTEWLVTFLEQWKLSVAQNGQGGEALVTFIQGVIDKLGKIYILLTEAGVGHYKWVQGACMSSLLHQLKTISD
jgi:hypothetical protein